jgi:hypothetical protein
MYRIVPVLVSASVAASLLHASPVASVTFSMDDLSFEQCIHGSDTFQIPHVVGASLATDSLGAPDLPFKTVTLLIPQDRTCIGVDVTYETQQVLDSVYNVYPTQTPVIIGEEPGPFVEPDSAIYESDSAFPSSLASLLHEGYRYGYKLVTVRVYPLTYRPASRELTFHSEVRLSLNLEACENEAVPVLRRSSIAQGHIERVISGTVSNPEDVRGYFLGREFRLEGGAGEPKRLAITDLPSVQGNCVDYVLITTDELVDAFKPLITTDELVDAFKPLEDWKTRKGVVTATRTVGWIDEHYTGCDRQERIRNFIRDAHRSWGTTWVLLGADTRFIPPRWTTREEPYDWVGCPADLYYECLDGRWNKNGNDVFGEPLDTADWDPDVELGRAPVETPAEVEVFLTKDSVYSRNPPSDSGDYLSSILMAAAGYKEMGGLGFGCMNKEKIISEILDPHWPDRDTWELYGPQRDTGYPYRWEGNELLSSGSFELALQRGYHFVNHYDHASPWSLGAWADCPDQAHDKVLTQAQVQGLTNGPRYSIVWSAGCDPCAMDHECIAEDFMNNPLGGAIAFVGNSRTGIWGRQTNMDKEFYRAIFEDSCPTLGAAFVRSQLGNYSIDEAKTEQLLGDPELRFWTVGQPQPLQVAFPDSIQLGEQGFEVTVTSNSVPVCSAQVCVYKLSADGQVEVYARESTDNNGSVTLAIRPETAGEMSVVATAYNYLPAESACSVVSGGSPYLRFSSCPLIDDDTSGLSKGNGDHIVNPGETLELTVELQNTGGGTAVDVAAGLSTMDAFVSVLQDSGEFGNIAAESCAMGVLPYVFKVDSCRPDSLPDIEFILTMTGSGGLVWTDQFRLSMLADSPALCGSRLVEGPDSTFTLDSLAITNYGWGAAAGVEALLTSMDPGSYEVQDSLSAIGDIGAGSTVVSSDADPLVYRYVGGSPSRPPEQFLLTLRDRYGRSWQREIDMLAPPAPASVSYRGVGDDHIEVIWDSVPVPDLKGYNVYRSGSSGGPFERVNEFIVDSNATYTDEGLGPYTRYFYSVTAVDFSGNEGPPCSTAVEVWTNPPYQAGWPAKTASGFQQRTSGACGNVIGNDSIEVVAVMGCSIYVWTADGQRAPGWPKGLGIVPHSSPALADVDNDGYDEIFLGVGDASWVYAWNGDSTTLPGAWPVQTPPQFTGSVAIADVNHDGVLEIVGVAGYMAYVWNAAGSVVASWPRPLVDGDGDPSMIHGSPAIADIDQNEPGLEMVFLARKADPDTGACLFVMSKDGNVLWKANLQVGEPWAADLSSPVVGDLDGDESLEVIVPVAASPNLYVFRWDGQLIGTLPGSGFGSPALADLDEDGNPDIVTADGGLRAWSLRGGGFDTIIHEGTELRAGPIVADVNGDNHGEIVTSYINGDAWTERVLAYDRTGNLQLNHGFPIYGVDEPMQEMEVADLDLDGDMELIAFTCAGGLVKVWDLPVPYDRRKVEWGSFHGDVRHTGLYSQPVSGTAAHDLYWWGRYKLFGDLTVSDHDLTVQPGTWVQAGPQLTPPFLGITVNGGAFAAKGTRSAPTYFEPELLGQMWDGVRVDSGSVAVTGCSFAGATEGLAATNCTFLQASGDTFANCGPVGAITCIGTTVSAVESCYFTGSGSYDIFVNNLGWSNPCVITGNDFDNSADYGIWAEYSPAAVIADNRLSTARSSSQYGIKCLGTSGAPPLPYGDIAGNTIRGYGQGGILCDGSSPHIYGHNDVDENYGIGLCCLQLSCPAVESCAVTDHHYGVVAMSMSFPILGDTQGYGHNTIDNSFFNVINVNESQLVPVMAENNWWGQSPPAPLKFLGNVDYVPWETLPPGDGMQEKPIVPVFPLALGQGRPNPFSSATRVMLSNPRQQKLVVSIYDVTGRHVQTLLDAYAPPGRSWLSWDGADAKGRRVGSGVYFCRLIAGTEKKVSRIVYVRGK